MVALSTGGGNLHLAPSKESMEAQQRQAATQATSIMDLLMGQLISSWNVSHVIHKLRFGPEYPNAIYQLDNVQKDITDTYGMYQYYFQVVPTTYKFMNGTTINTNQYSVTEHLRHVDFGQVRGLPGVFFFYEVSPLHVVITESYRKGWISFFTSVCAVVGGVVTVMGMLDQYLFRTKRGPGGLAQ
uniref:Endoplasmic reticulum vesicle transporter C-terminal domain-containing protein n=1 Tax=Entomoneis paludosa TaxID=265537 RepID=A0A7S3DNX8_9STRA